jgi:uncharacterized protein (TIGR03437 family)
MCFRTLLLGLFGTNLLFSATAVIKSTDGGRTWIDIDPGTSPQEIVDLQIASDGTRLFALTKQPRIIIAASISWAAADYSVLSSSDGGRTWREMEPLRVTGASYASLAVAPSDSRILYVMSGTPDWNQPVFGLRRTSFVVQRSTDGGRTAEMFRMSDGEILRPSETNGLLWIRTGPLAVHPTIPTTLFLSTLWSIDFDATYSGTLQSADGGAAWQFSRRVGLTHVQAEPAEPSTLYARHLSDPDAPKRYLAKSTDGGRDWSLKFSDVVSLALNPRDSGVLVAGRNNGSLWKSNDGAETWAQLGTFLPFARIGFDLGSTTERMVVYPGKPSLVLAQAPALGHQGVNTGEIFRIRDDGSASTVIPTGMDGFTFVFDPSDPNTIYGISEKRLEPRLHPPYVRNLAGGSVLAPGSLFSVYGDDLSGEVTFDGQPAQVLYASRRQINGQVPSGLKPGEVLVSVAKQPADGPQQVDRQPVTLSWNAPVILHESSGAPRIYHLDGERPITGDDPALPGEAIVAYCTGLGQPATPFVQFWPTDRPDALHPTSFTEPVTNSPGVYRVGIEVPRSLGEGSYLLLFWGGRNTGRLEVR